ncbi:MAG: histidine ammonia-lyase [Actinomycetota bacterium]|jgi:histidine ammonia-lyase|nr:histidine ammonia-lyase [Actinomycetota bacterium]
MSVHVGDALTFEGVVAVASAGEQVDIAAGTAERMAPARAVIEEAVHSGLTIYGITTGFGGLSNVRIEPSEAEDLQRDIVRSHATAVGPLVPRDVVRAMLLLKARTFAFGISGVRFETVELLVNLLNEGIHPIVPAQGSLGASGDLALLAHLALPLMGEGQVEIDGNPLPAGEALRSAGLTPLKLSFKEGLALVNGTEAMLAYGILAYDRSERLARAADITGAMTIEACLGTDRAFDAELIALRKHPGAPRCASNLRRLLADSPIVRSHKESDHLVQDAYSLRCIPQVHGAYRDGLEYVRGTLEAELASAIDNPSVLPGTGEVISGGNFHGEALGLALDHLGLCLTGYGTIAERRIARLVDPELNNGLPAFLTPDPGRRSGFMLPQYTAASLVSESRTLCFPASSDSIPTSAGQEDHVSMGATSARKAMAILANTEHVIAIEALAAAQGLDLREPLNPAAGTGAAREAVRSVSPRLDEDRSLADDIGRVRRALQDGSFEGPVVDAIGPLD